MTLACEPTTLTLVALTYSAVVPSVLYLIAAVVVDDSSMATAPVPVCTPESALLTSVGAEVAVLMVGTEVVLLMVGAEVAVLTVGAEVAVLTVGAVCC